MKRWTCAVLAAVPLCALAGAAHGGIILGENLLNNHDAEAGPGGSGQVVPVPGWSVTQGLFTVAEYGATPDLLSAGDPGPADRGQNYFTGGSSLVSVAEQRYNLFPLAAQIDNGSIGFELSGWLGSANTDFDSATLRVSFLDSNLDHISGAGIGTIVDRGIAPVSGLSYYEFDGFIPVGAREAVVELSFDRNPGGDTYSDGAADNLSFVIVPSPGPVALLGVASAMGLRRRR